MRVQYKRIGLLRGDVMEMVENIAQKRQEIARNRIAYIFESASVPRSMEPAIVLEGIQVRKEKYYALINGEVFTVGDNIDKFSIVEIHTDQAVLQDRQTNNIKTIYLKS